MKFVKSAALAFALFLVSQAPAMAQSTAPASGTGVLIAQGAYPFSDLRAFSIGIVIFGACAGNWRAGEVGGREHGAPTRDGRNDSARDDYRRGAHRRRDVACAHHRRLHPQGLSRAWRFAPVSEEVDRS